jgi:hypothetical protein
MNPQDARKQAAILNMTAEILVSMAEKIEALEALLSPPALLPIADVPVREVTGIDVDEDFE